MQAATCQSETEIFGIDVVGTRGSDQGEAMARGDEGVIEENHARMRLPWSFVHSHDAPS